MYIHRMVRTQLYLDDAVHRRLRQLARRQGQTLSDLVRDALAKMYGKRYAPSAPAAAITGVLFAFFDAHGEVAIDALTGRRAGVYLSRYARSHGVEIADALIAAAASTAGLHLWTRHRRHYPMDDLRLYRGSDC